MAWYTTRNVCGFDDDGSALPQIHVVAKLLIPFNP